MYRNRDLPMQMAIRKILSQVLGPQARLVRRPDGAISVSPNSRKVLVVPDGDRLLIVGDEPVVRCELNALGPEGFAAKYRERAKVGELWDPNFGSLRRSLQESGYADLFDERQC